MIVKSMSWNEVSKEILREELYILEKANEVSIQKYRRRVIKGYTGPLPIYTLKSQGHNTYHILAINNGKSDLKRRGRFSHTIWIRRVVDGKIYFLILLGIKCGGENYSSPIIVFSAHLIQRYSERYLNKPDLPLSEAFEKFIRRCSFPTVTFFPDQIIGVIDDGVMFGELDDGVLIYKTFITENMLFENQTESVDIVKAAREWSTNKILEEKKREKLI